MGLKLLNAACCVFILSILLMPVVANSEESSEEEQRRYYFIGSVGNNNIQMELIFDSDDVSGWYYYDKKGVPLLLSGTALAKDSTIELNEKSEKGVVSGSFKGKIISEGSEQAMSIQGQWSDPGGEKHFTFNLSKVADFESTKKSIREKIHSSLLYPEFLSKDPAFSTINSNLSKSMEAEQGKFLTEASEFFSTEDSAGGWQESRSYSIAYYSEELVSLVGEVYSYTGGAHGNTFYLSSNYSIKDSKASLLRLGDLFKAGSNYVKALSSYCMNDLLLQEAGWITSGEIKSFTEKELEVFAITPEGIKFAFAPYAVGSYAEGSYFVTVPFGELKRIIDPKGTLGHFLNQSSK